MKLLIIDDDFQDLYECQFMEAVLRQYEFSWEFVRDCDAGVDRLRANPGIYRVIFLDIEFGERAEAPRIIDAIRSFDHTTPIILISGNEWGNKFLAKRKKKGVLQCQGYITKSDWNNPASRKRIYRILDRIAEVG